jgi:hypothetical protein
MKLDEKRRIFFLCKSFTTGFFLVEKSNKYA